MEINIIKINIGNIIGLSWKFERTKPENVVYNEDVYPWTLREFVNRFKRNVFGRPIKIGIVWGTTRHRPSDCKHAGYISDAIYIPELIQKFFKLNREIVFESFFDIDVTDEILKVYNLILCGDGEVNYIVTRLLRFVGDAIEIRYEAPDRPFFMEKTSRVKHHMCGVVHLLRNPWNKDRFIIHLGGIGPVGTAASLKWLCDKLDDPSLLPESPFVVVKGEEREYPPKFNGYENHCEHCCKVKEIIDGEERIYWRGKISNVAAVIQIYP